MERGEKEGNAESNILVWHLWPGVCTCMYGVAGKSGDHNQPRCICERFACPGQAHVPSILLIHMHLHIPTSVSTSRK